VEVLDIYLDMIDGEVCLCADGGHGRPSGMCRLMNPWHERGYVRAGRTGHPVSGQCWAPGCGPGSIPFMDTIGIGRPVLERGLLHASLSDPAMESMNLLNQVAERYPKAVSM